MGDSVVNEAPSNKVKLIRSLGLLRDGIWAAKPALDAGFGIAERSVDFSFELARKGVAAPLYVASWLTETQTNKDQMNHDSQAKPNATAAAPIHAVLDAAHSITRNSLRASWSMTELSLRASDLCVGLTGAERGETLRMLQEYVEAQAREGKDDAELKEALLGLCTMLVDLGSRLTVRDPILLLRGARQLALVHQHRRDCRMTNQRQRVATLTLPNGPELDQLSHFMRFAAAAYGYRACRFLGTMPKGIHPGHISSDEEFIFALTGVPIGDILRVTTGTMYCPAHFVAVDRNERQVVVAIRGTLSLEDALVDLVCESQELVSIYDGDEIVEGQAHRGFLRSAQRLAGDLHQLVMETLRDNEGYELVITGHSLGGGTATLLALLWARIPEFRSRNIRAVAFAAPCSVCEEISQAPFTRRHVTSIVTRDDVVSRLGLATFKELQRDMVALAPMDGTSLEHQEQVLNELTPVEDKLFCAGRVWWLDSAEYSPHPIVEIDPVEELQSIELFSDIFAVHLPNSYLETLSGLDERRL